MTRLHLATEVRFLRIDTTWTLREEEVSGRRFAIPSIRRDKVGNVTTSNIDGWEVRRRLQKLKDSEQAVLDFLHEVGVWSAVVDPAASEAMFGGKLLSGPIGSRYLSGRAVPLEVDMLWRWKNHFSDISSIKRQFGPPPVPNARPIDKLKFAVERHFLNELPLHIEWRRSKPFAVIETITAMELLIATTNLDMLRGGKWKVCELDTCRMPFPVLTEHDKKYCSWDCAHVMSSRKSRRRKKKDKKNAKKH
jgi:hypothetical protein